MNKSFPVNCLFFLLLSSLVSCSSGFYVIDPDFKPKGKTLAVIAGLDYEANVLAAQYMTEALQKYSRFQVMPQKQVGQSLSGYPFEITGPYKRFFSRIDIDYSNTDIKMIRKIQQRLGVDYLYVVWTYSSTSDEGKVDVLYMIGQLFVSPNGKEAGHGRFKAKAGWSTCCLVPILTDEDKAKAIKDRMELLVKDIAQSTDMTKKEASASIRGGQE